jgi:RimJ/RimL family protein N-acetyltransferase
MNLQPILSNKFVTIRPLEKTDLEPLFQVASDPKIWEQHPASRHIRPEFEKFFTESLNSKGALAIIDNDSLKIIGSSRYKEVEAIPNAIEIGWTFLDRKYWGGQYNKQVKDLMISHAFEYGDNVIFFVAKTNIRSQKAVEKINGFRIEQSTFNNFPENHVDDLTYLVNKRNK